MEVLACGCGPYFDSGGDVTSILILLVVKPLTYYAFINAFRYRVSRDIPMRRKQAAILAGVRSLAGFAIIGVVVVLSNSLGWFGPWAIVGSYGILCLERLVVWGALGYAMAGLRGRRWIGWTLSGVAVDAAFDFSMFAEAFVEPYWTIITVGLIGAFIAALEMAGRRDSLRRRFSSDPRCVRCGYILTGNLSGICPECGKAVIDADDPKTLCARCGFELANQIAGRCPDCGLDHEQSDGDAQSSAAPAGAE